MTDYAQGQTATLDAEFFAYLGGPLADVTSLTIRIQHPDGTDAVPSTMTGVVHDSTGLYHYEWAIPFDAPLGGYVITWIAVGVTATDTANVVSGSVTLARTWPPTLTDLKNDMDIPPSNTDDDGRMATDLAAAIDYVQRVRPSFNYGGDLFCSDEPPTNDIWQGTLAYARRLVTRRRSPDMLIDMGQLGAGRVPSVDRDIDRMLGIGQFAEGVTA